MPVRGSAPSARSVSRGRYDVAWFMSPGACGGRGVYSGGRDVGM